MGPVAAHGTGEPPDRTPGIPARGTGCLGVGTAAGKGQYPWGPGPCAIPAAADPAGAHGCAQGTQGRGGAPGAAQRGGLPGSWASLFAGPVALRSRSPGASRRPPAGRKDTERSGMGKRHGRGLRPALLPRVDARDPAPEAPVSRGGGGHPPQPAGAHRALPGTGGEALGTGASPGGEGAAGARAGGHAAAQCGAPAGERRAARWAAGPVRHPPALQPFLPHRGGFSSSAPGPLPRAQSLPAALLRAGYSPGAAAHAAGVHVA